MTSFDSVNILPSTHHRQHISSTHKLYKSVLHSYRTLKTSNKLILYVVLIVLIGVITLSTATYLHDTILNASKSLFHVTSGEPTIYVSLASYRDPQCHKTIKDMYKKAQYPDRIHVGIYQQHGEKEDDCLKDLDQYDYIYHQNIQIQRVHFSEGLGM